MINWKDIEKGEIPVNCIDCCIVIYMDDYEFGRYNGRLWQVYYENEWTDVNENIRYWGRLDKPEPETVNVKEGN